jgi:MFS family permease
MKMGDMHDAGRRVGGFLTCVALGAVAGPPISGAISQATDGFKSVGYYAGTIMIFSILDTLLKCPLLISLLRIVHPWSCRVYVSHEIPDDRLLTRKVLTPTLKEWCISLGSRVYGDSNTLRTSHR